MPLIDLSGRPVTSQTTLEPGAGAGASPYCKDTDLANFPADVLQASIETPVIVDFWAPSCEPCKTLGPMLQKLVAEAKGAVRLVKVNVDDNPEIAQQLRIQSVPTVYAFKNGQPVDGFMGAVPESQLRLFIQNLTGDTAAAVGIDDALGAADQALLAGDIGGAAQIYGQILQDDPGHPKAVAGLAKCYLQSGDLERARKTLGLVRPDGAADESIRAVDAELTLKETVGAATADVAAARARVAAAPADLQARYDLALGLDGSGDRDGAIEQLLAIIKADRKWNDDAARKHLVTLFDAMGPADPRTIAARRHLSSLLFS